MKMKKNKKFDRAEEWPTFDQIRGYEIEVKRLKAIAAALRSSNNFAVFPKGIMLSGIPGTGKTTLAKAFILATGFPVFSPGPCPDAKALSNIYEKASRKVPSIVFLDDVDRIVSTSGIDGFASDESRTTLKELLDRLDGVGQSYGVITVMTTNEYYNLDDALKRSGRVDLHIPMERPNDLERKQILQYYMDQYPDFFPQDGGKLAEIVAGKSQDMTCADLKLIVKDVYLLNYGVVADYGYPDFADAFQARIMELNCAGLLKHNCKNDEDMKRICLHETGHAILDWILTGKASDICCLQSSVNDATAGWTAARNQDETSQFFNYDDCMKEITISLGGMAAEKLFMGDISQGASNDIAQACSMSQAVLAACLDGDFSYLPGLVPNSGRFAEPHSQTDEFIHRVQKREQEMLAQGYEEAIKCLKAYELGVRKLSDILYEEGILSAERVTEILDGLVPQGKKKGEEKK